MNTATLILTIAIATLGVLLLVSTCGSLLWLMFRKPAPYVPSATPVAWNNLPW